MAASHGDNLRHGTLRWGYLFENLASDAPRCLPRLPLGAPLGDSSAAATAAGRTEPFCDAHVHMVSIAHMLNPEKTTKLFSSCSAFQPNVRNFRSHLQAPCSHEHTDNPSASLVVLILSICMPYAFTGCLFPTATRARSRPIRPANKEAEHAGWCLLASGRVCE